jgi:autophagy-related protein 9
MPNTGRSSRNMSDSRSFHASPSQSFFASGLASSRPFLNMLNPMSRTHRGYSQANQSLLEEDERTSEDEEDLEAGRSRSTIFHSGTTQDIPLANSRTKVQRKVSWGIDPSDMNVLRPNIHHQDKIHEQDSSDDEVPQSLMIEAASKKPTPVKGKGKSSHFMSDGGRSQPLHSASGRKLPPILPTAAGTELPPSVSIPPRPLEVDDGADGEVTPRNSSPGTGFREPASDYRRQPTHMRGLDDYEKALWNWVNVYNLDAFLQEVYYYYEGKGIYSIALSRGLNLLFVKSPSHLIACNFDCQS